MKRLISEEELRDELEEAYAAGVNYGWGGSPEFDDWYDEVYGGPDCE
jgi:hypothetical protein